jgi:hypothetical protein
LLGKEAKKMNITIGFEAVWIFILMIA